MKEREEQQRLFDQDGNARERLVVWIRRRMDEYGITIEALAESIEADANAKRTGSRAPFTRDRTSTTSAAERKRSDCSLQAGRRAAGVCLGR